MLKKVENKNAFEHKCCCKNLIKKRQLIGMQTAMTVNVVVDSECFDGFKDSRNLTKSNYFEKKEGTSNVQNRRDEGTVQRTVKNDIDDSKLIEVDNSYTYMNIHLVLVDELSMGIRIVSMKIIISSKEGIYRLFCLLFFFVVY